MEEKRDKISREIYHDTYYSTFHGFDVLEKEFRADGWFYGKAKDFAESKEELIRQRPRNCLDNPMSGCYILSPLYVLAYLKDTAVIVHGPTGCVKHLYDFVNLFHPNKKVFSTNMDEKDVLMGGEEKLKNCIREVYNKYKPNMMGVVETCSSSIIGEDTEGICQTMENEFGIPVIAFHASGFKHRNWNLGADEAFNKLIDRMEKSSETRKGYINFINFHTLGVHWKEFFEILPYLQRLGVKINTHVPYFMPFQELIDKFPKAELNIVRCTGVGYQSAEYAEKKLGIPYLQLPKCASLKYTERYIRGIAEFFGRQDEAEALIKEEKEKIKDRLEKAKARLEGKRVAVACGPGKSMGLCQMLTELGMEIVYIAIHKTDSRFHELLREWLDSSGQDPELLSEPGYYEEEAILTRLRPDIYIGLTEQRMQLDRLGIATIDMIGLTTPQVCGFKGMVLFAEHMVAVLENKLFKNYHRYLWNRFPIFSSAEFLSTSPMATQTCRRGKNTLCGYYGGK